MPGTSELWKSRYFASAIPSSRATSGASSNDALCINITKYQFKTEAPDCQGRDEGIGNREQGTGIRNSG